MANRFMNLQAQLRRIQHQVHSSFRAALRLMQSHSFFANTARIFQQLQFVNQLISSVLVLSAASLTGSSFTRPDAFAISMACAAVLSTASRLRSSVEAKPQASFTSTRMPTPNVSALLACPTLPFLVASERWR